MATVKFIRAVLIMASHLGLVSSWTGCHKSSSGKSSGVNSQLTISGFVTDGGSLAQPGTEIFLPGVDYAFSYAQTRGEFRVSLSQAQLADIELRQRNQLKDQAPAFFRLHFSKRDQGLETMAVSEPIPFSSRGNINLGEVYLEPGVNVSGQVEVVEKEGKRIPGRGLTVLAGRTSIMTDDRGQFTMGGVPRSLKEIYVIGEGTTVGFAEVSLKGGLENVLPQPILIFPVDEVSGFVSLLPEEDVAELIASGHPYLRRFSVAPSAKARFIRYHHDEEKFKAGQAEWLPVNESFGYDFPGNGGYTLFVQFADETRTRVSEVLSLRVSVDTFSDGSGFIIEDGSGVIHSRRAKLAISVPAAAVRMKLAENPLALTNAPLLNVADEVEFLFQIPDPGRASPLVSVYLQFLDERGSASVVYSATARLEVFPRQEQAFTIEDGADVTAERLVWLDIKVPENAHLMRVFEEKTSSGYGSVYSGGSVHVDVGGRFGDDQGDEVWLQAQEQYFHIFKSEGQKQVFLQFMDAEGVRSPVYSQTIFLRPFADVQVGMVINNGDMVTPVPGVVLSFYPPIGSVSFRIFEEGKDPNQNNNWINVVPEMPYAFNGYGLKKIYVQYRNMYGDISASYDAAIFFDPFPAGFDGLSINDSDATTTDPQVTLTLTPPPLAVRVRITENYDDLLMAAPLAVSPSIPFTLSAGLGVKTIYLQYETEDGTLSAVFSGSIEVVAP